MKEKLVVAIILLTFLVSTGLLVKRVAGSDFSWKLPSFSSLFSKNINQPAPSPFSSSIPTTSPTFKITNPLPTPKPTPPLANKPTSAPVACFKFKITHLDGSTSNLCYTQADYQQLQNLQFKLTSAKTFYQFHLDDVNKYQELYEETNSNIYLDAKANSQAKADSEKAKMDSINAQMAQIEQRDW